MTELKEENKPISSSASQLLKKLDQPDNQSFSDRFSSLQSRLSKLLGAIKDIALQFGAALRHAKSPAPRAAPRLGSGSAAHAKKETEDKSDGN